MIANASPDGSQRADPRPGEDEESVVSRFAWIAINMARRNAPALGVEEADAVSDGMMGLMYAARGFDASRRVSFVTYATATVAGKMLNGRRDRERRGELRHAYDLLAVAGAVEDASDEPLSEETIEDLVPGYLDAKALVRASDVVRFGDLTTNIDEVRAAAVPDLAHAALEFGEILDALDRLPYNHRNAIRLHFLYGVSRREVADATGVSTTTVDNWIARGLDRLRADPAIADPAVA